jgi:hypothetical protein
MKRKRFFSGARTSLGMSNWMLPPHSTALAPGFDATCLTNRKWPDLAVHLDRSALATVVVHNGEVGVPVRDGVAEPVNCLCVQATQRTSNAAKKAHESCTEA